MSQPSWSAMDIAKLAQVLTEAKESGLLDSALAVMNANPVLEAGNRLDDGLSVTSWEEVTPGAMTDASKRRSTAMEAPPSVGVATRVCGAPVPVVPPSMAPALTEEQWRLLESRGHGLVPPNIAMKEWADTLLDFGKYKAEHLSFVELVSSTCPRKVDYCKWVIDHENAKSTVQFKDLAAFLRVFKAVFPAHANEPVFPGSQITRVFKSK